MIPKNIKRLPNGQIPATLGSFKSVEERNYQIVKDYKQHIKHGQSMLWMVNKYQMSTQRIYKILHNMGAIDNGNK